MYAQRYGRDDYPIREVNTSAKRHEVCYRDVDWRFFARPAQQLARSLLRCVLIHDTPHGRLVGRIVETEAYDEDDPASHSYRGVSARNYIMFARGGLAYVYRSYGMHWCMNVTAGRRGFGAAVLLRALEPLEGALAMAKLRALAPERVRDLARGPGRLAQAMAIDARHYGADLCAGPLRVALIERAETLQIETTPRIGISKGVQTPWRFCLAGNPYVSGPRTLRAQVNHS